MYTFHLDDKHVAHISDPTKIGPNFGARYIVKTIITGWYKKNYNKNLNITKELKEKGPFSNLQHTALAAGFGVEKSFDDFYEDISSKNKTSGVVGSDKTRYKAEQSWFTWPSVFDNVSYPETSGVCSTLSRWSYEMQPVSDSQITDRDIKFDYMNNPGSGSNGGGYYDDYKNSFNSDGQSKKPKETDKIKKYEAQMPVQGRIHSDDGKG
ncbi:hypothetical protein LCGC14_2636510, partial [marine sediment metagenome]